MSFWKNLVNKGPIVALAPMDGYTDSAYRQIVKKINPEVICFSEFFSADGIVRSKFLAKSVLPHHISEKPLIIQIFGKDPEMFRQAAIIIESYGIAGIDVNMGCPAKKVVQSGHGSSLMINVDTAYKIIEEMSKAVKIPISVKTRLGYNDTSNLISFAKGLENAGAKLITVHGRTYKQAFTGEADWTMIYELKKNLNIPVIGNGDVKNYEDGIKRITNDKLLITNENDSNIVIPTKVGIQNPNSVIASDSEAIQKILPRHSELVSESKIDTEINSAGRYSEAIQKTSLMDYHDFSHEKSRDSELNPNLDGFMIGRASFGNPWCFAKEKKEITMSERLDIMKEHARLLIELKGRKGALESRKHMVQYLHGFPGVKHYRGELVKVENYEDVVKVIEEIRRNEVIN